eukprot:scaffold1399_cov410-Prasinococcus_capsulatus_cf.AAC.42
MQLLLRGCDLCEAEHQSRAPLGAWIGLTRFDARLSRYSVFYRVEADEHVGPPTNAAHRTASRYFFDVVPQHRGRCCPWPGTAGARNSEPALSESGWLEGGVGASTPTGGVRWKAHRSSVHSWQHTERGLGRLLSAVNLRTHRSADPDRRPSDTPTSSCPPLTTPRWPLVRRVALRSAHRTRAGPRSSADQRRWLGRHEPHDDDSYR